MKNKKSPVKIVETRFNFLDVESLARFKDRPWDLCYSRQHDFYADWEVEGLAVYFTLENENYFLAKPKGMRRKLLLSLIDVTANRMVSERTISVLMKSNEMTTWDYAVFSPEEGESLSLSAGHSYNFVFRDRASGECVHSETIHIYDRNCHGYPEEWYSALSGGIRLESGEGIYRSVDVQAGSRINVRFEIKLGMEHTYPDVLPELELRIREPYSYRPGRPMKLVSSFHQPEILVADDNSYFVEKEIITQKHLKGVYYAEILCMERPIAGFVFKTVGQTLEGEWSGDSLLPLDNAYPSCEDARDRYCALVQNAGIAEAEDLDDRFDRLLEEFISDSEPGGTVELHYFDSESGNRQENEEEKETLEENTKSKEGEQKENCWILNEPAMGMEHLVGLSKVKEKLARYERMVRFQQIRARHNLIVNNAPLHSMFLGSPGTGKTTVAKLMGRMLHDAGVLSKGHVVVCERATLLGQNYNSEAEKTLEAIEKAQGGILLIDEAYQLYQPNDPRDPGKFVIETLLTALSDESKTDWMLILAGYSDEMKKMLDMNPGFKSRIPDTNIYVFDDYSELELMEIAERYLEAHQYKLSPEADERLRRRLSSDYNMRSRNFGNARHVLNLIQTEILPSMAVRVTSSGVTDIDALTVIMAADIPVAANESESPVNRRIGFA